MSTTIPQHYVQNAKGEWNHPSLIASGKAPQCHGKPPISVCLSQEGIKSPPTHKPLLNKTEARWKAVMVSRGLTEIMEQAITLRLDPPFKSYRADFAYLFGGLVLCLVEVKGPHRFREKGIAKAALAAKCYPGFKFELVEWDGHQWKESVL